MAQDSQKKPAQIISLKDFRCSKKSTLGSTQDGLPSITHPSEIEFVDPSLTVSDQEAEWSYQSRILAMGKIELLEEMVRYQEERSRRPSRSALQMLQGQHLFSAIEKSAETQELRTLARSYRRHLTLELQQFREHQRNSSGSS